MRWGSRRRVTTEQPAVTRPPQAPARGPASAPPYVVDEGALFAFLEASVAGSVETTPAPHAVTARALELANDDWPEELAARELVTIAGGDRQALKRTHYQLQLTLLGPLVDVLAVRAGRIVYQALRLASGR